VGVFVAARLSSCNIATMSALTLHHRFYDMLMQSQYWSAERMQEHQRSQLAQLLRHAKKSVPFYQTRLDAVLRSDGDVDWDRWHDLPLVTRHNLQTQHDAMQARERPPGHHEVETSRSSGSTGRPIVTTQTGLTALAASSATARSYDWHRIDIRRTHVSIFGDDPAVAPYPDGELYEPWGPPVLRSEGQPGRQYRLNLAATPEQALEFIVRHRPTYLSGLVTRVSVLAHEAARLGLDIRAEAVLPFGEAVTPTHRKLFQEAFGARVLQSYASQETHRVAHACPENDHLHVNAELALVEILDEAGLPAAPGAPGRVVITPFYNTAQPLIRYEIGDIATAGGTSC